MRIPLAVSLESRDGTLAKDAKVMNAFLESQGPDVPAIVRKRPGYTDLGTIHSGTAQALTYWNGSLITVQGDTLNGATVFTGPQWNPSDKGSSITLSGGNLVAVAASATTHCVREVFALSGKKYWEVAVTTLSGVNFAAGVADATQSLTAGGLGFSTHSTAAVRSNGNIVFNSVAFSAALTPVQGDVIGFAFDDGVLSGTRQLLIYQNNTLRVTVASANLPSAVCYPAVGGNGNTGATTYTASFGPTFSYTPPTGYTAITGTGISGATTTALSPTSANLQFSVQDNGGNSPNPQLMLKNATQAWTYSSGGTLAQITDVDYPGQYTVTLTSLTRSGTVATASTASDTNFQVGGVVTIAGATPSTYNGAQTITGVTPSGSISNGNTIAVTITRSGTTATATTVTDAHGYSNGQTITISGAAQQEYNGSFVITVISGTQFSYTVTVTTGGTTTTNFNVTSPATGSPYVAPLVRYGSASLAAGTLTVTLANHGYATGAHVSILGFPDGVNGLGRITTQGAAITVVDSATFTVAASVGTLFTPSVQIYSQPTSPNPSSITASGATATVTFAAAHYISNSDTVSITGCTQPYYNGANITPTVTSSTTFTYTIAGQTTVSDSPVTPATGTIVATPAATVTPASFTFTIGGSPTTPATGTITASGGRTTVPGIAYLDGYFVVMDVNAVLYNSAEDDPSTWNALEYLTARAETGAGKAIARSLNYVVAFKEWSTEFFYDAGNAVGSPLSPVDNGLVLVGCASGDSLASLDGNLVWLSQVRQFGRSVHVMQGLQVQKISTPDVERVLNADDLATVRAIAVKLDGHAIYLLTLETSGITLAYDMQSQKWGQWTSCTAGSAVSVSSITLSGTTATVTTSGAHGINDGEPVTIAGANQSGYNGTFQAYVSSTTVFTIQVSGSPVTPATGTITATPYTESYFKLTKYTDANGVPVALGESDGHAYKLTPSAYQDNSVPIDVFIRSTRLDGGTEDSKTMPYIRLAGDAVTDIVAVRWSDDDSATFKPYRIIDMSNAKPETRRCGSFRRRSIEFRHVGNNPLRLEAAEIGG